MDLLTGFHTMLTIYAVGLFAAGAAVASFLWWVL